MSDYQTFAIQRALDIEAGGVNWEFPVDSERNLIGIARSSRVRGFVEVHVVSAASQYRQFSVQVRTPIDQRTTGPLGVEEFVLTKDDDLGYIQTEGTNSGFTGFHVLTKASDYRSYRLQIPLGLPLRPAGRNRWSVSSVGSGENAVSRLWRIQQSGAQTGTELSNILDF